MRRRMQGFSMGEVGTVRSTHFAVGLGLDLGRHRYHMNDRARRSDRMTDVVATQATMPFLSPGEDASAVPCKYT
jgi:hypothetical protein